MRTFSRTLAAFVAAGALLVGAAPADARRGCPSSTSKGAKILAKTREAVVFSKSKTHPQLGSQAIRFGCMYRVGRNHRLTPFTDFDNTFANLRLAGRYAAFSWDVEEGAGSTTNHTLYVYDLRTGKVERRIGDVAPGETNGADSSTPVYAIVLKRNASLAWTASFDRKIREEPVPGGHSDVNETVFQVHKIDNELADRRTMLDEGADIEPDSLALGDDRRTVFWTRGGQPRSAELR